MSKKEKRKTGRNRRLRLRLFHSGNTKCPICLSEFTRSDVAAGKVTLEHAPPESLKGSAVCLTCIQCNNKASRMEQHAILAKREREEWSSGRGTRVEIDFFGNKKSSRYISTDPNAAFPTRVRDLRNGSIKLGALPPKARLDAKEGIRFRIPISSHYESVSMIKSAYLMVFSLMGIGGYKFAESVALKPVREQIMNPEKRILTNFCVEGTMPETEKAKKQMVFLCHAARPPLWMIPMWDGKLVLLPCGGPEPIDKFVVSEGEIKIEYNQLIGWTTCRFNESLRITGLISEESGIADGTLVGRPTDVVPTDKGGWEWMIVDHHLGQYVALPFRPANENLHSDSLYVVEMLGDHAVKGRGLDKSVLTRLNLGEWSKDMTISGKAENPSSQPKTNKSREGRMAFENNRRGLTLKDWKD